MIDKRDTTINLRLSPEEKQEWQVKAVRAGIPLSTLIRMAMSKTQTWTTGDRALIQKQARQLTRIGNNLNQIAKWANAYKGTAEAIEVIEALIALEEILSQMSIDQPSSSKTSQATGGENAN